MSQFPITGFTKDKKEIIIRRAVEDDAVNLIDLKKSYIKNTTSIPLYEFEYVNDIEQEKEWIKSFYSRENSFLLVAEHGNTLIGNIDLWGSHRKKLFHTGMIGMGIHNSWQNKGIGSLLMKNILHWAAIASPLEIIWLEVYSTNLPGIKLYEKYGFEQCGVMHNFFREEIPADKITMVKYLK